jgi:transposase
VEAASAWPCTSPGDIAAGNRGLKRGLATRKRTVILMLDETIITETPPLYACYGHIGEQVCVPITGNHARRILHGVLNVQNGEVLLLITEEWVQETHQAFLIMIRSHWRGWNIVLFEDRGSPHTVGESLRLAGELHIKLRFLPKATPELNAMDHLWRHVKGRGLANRATQSIDESADSACRYILDMSRRERLRKAGVLSGNFWLTKGLFCQRTF